jgi:hypothetical protein
MLEITTSVPGYHEETIHYYSTWDRSIDVGVAYRIGINF